MWLRIETLTFANVKACGYHVVNNKWTCLEQLPLGEHVLKTLTANTCLYYIHSSWACGHITGGEGAFVSKGGYDAHTWTLEIGPKQVFSNCFYKLTLNKYFH